MRLDPDCAMCHWASRSPSGPNINAPITEDAAKDAFAESSRREARAANASARACVHRRAGEAVRCGSEGRARAARSRLRDAMRELVKQYPDDLDAATLFAQSLMDTSPWNYWNLDGTPRRVHERSGHSLESVLTRKPITWAPSTCTSTPSKRRPTLDAHAVRRPPRRRSRPAPGTSCTCRRTSICAPRATTTLVGERTRDQGRRCVLRGDRVPTT
jgi:hypothetical protein